MIVDLDTRLWTSTDDLGDELSAAIRRAGASRWVQPDAGIDAMMFASRAVDASVVVGFKSALLRGSVHEHTVLSVAEQIEEAMGIMTPIDPRS